MRHLAGRPRSPSRERRDTYGYYAGENGGGGSYLGGRAMDPHELESLVPFRQFAEWFRFAHPEVVGRVVQRHAMGRMMLKVPSAAGAE